MLSFVNQIMKKLRIRTGKNLIKPIFPKESFGVWETEMDGAFALAVINAGYNRYPNKKFFLWSAQILIETGENDENGYPSANEAELLNMLEDWIEAFFKENHVTHFIGRLTRKGYRDIFYYLDRPNFDQYKTKKFFDEISAIRGINFYLKEDEKWDNVAQFIE
jgi:hypothetical protein